MHFDVLGPIGALDGGSPMPLGGALQRAVLAVLLVDPGRALTADQILTEVWGDDVDDRTRASLYTYVSNLRSVLGKERIDRASAGPWTLTATSSSSTWHCLEIALRSPADSGTRGEKTHLPKTPKKGSV